MAGTEAPSRREFALTLVRFVALFVASAVIYDLAAAVNGCLPFRPTRQFSALLDWSAACAFWTILFASERLENRTLLDFLWHYLPLLLVVPAFAIRWKSKSPWLSMRSSPFLVRFVVHCLVVCFIYEMAELVGVSLAAFPSFSPYSHKVFTSAAPWWLGVKLESLADSSIQAALLHYAPAVLVALGTAIVTAR